MAGCLLNADRWDVHGDDSCRQRVRQDIREARIHFPRNVAVGCCGTHGIPSCGTSIDAEKQDVLLG